MHILYVYIILYNVYKYIDIIYLYIYIQKIFSSDLSNIYIIYYKQHIFKTISKMIKTSKYHPIPSAHGALIVAAALAPPWSWPVAVLRPKRRRRRSPTWNRRGAHGIPWDPQRDQRGKPAEFASNGGKNRWDTLGYGFYIIVMGKNMWDMI